MSDQVSTDSTNEKNSSNPPSNGIGGLVAIIIGIVAGVLIGVFYGKSMWMASGGLERSISRMEATAKQKATFADEAKEEAATAQADGDDELATAKRKREATLRTQIPVIEKRTGELKAELVEHNGKLGKGDKQLKDDSYVSSMTTAEVTWELISFIGDLFLQVLKLLVIPLVVTSMICGITSLGDIRKVGRMGGYTIGYYMATGAVAVFVGILLVQIIQPGVGTDDTFAFVTENVEQKKDTGVLETLLNVFRGHHGDPGSGMFPSNIFLAASKTNVLALIVFAIVFGAALTTLGREGQVAIDFFKACNEAVMKMVHIVMLFAPVGIFGLVASNIAKNGGGSAFSAELARLGWYVGTVVIGLSVHVVVLATILAVVGKRNPITYTANILRALLTAVSSASSSATLPVTMECVEENNGVSNRSASFVLPLGATVNMDGTALYEAVAVIFIAQSLGIDLSTGQLVVIFLTATLAAVGAAGIPEAGLVTMVIVLTAVGLPMSGIGTILAIDWFLDRLRTTVNVYGDAIGAGVIDKVVVAEE